MISPSPANFIIADGSFLLHLSRFCRDSDVTGMIVCPVAPLPAPRRPLGLCYSHLELPDIPPPLCFLPSSWNLEACLSSCLLGRAGCCSFVTLSLGTQLAKQGGVELTNVLFPRPLFWTFVHSQASTRSGLRLCSRSQGQALDRRYFSEKVVFGVSPFGTLESRR